MFFVVDTHIADELGLTGSDLLVYSALAYLSKNKAWRGSTYKLAKYSMCGNHDTARRSLERLIAEGLIIKTTTGYQIAQNAPKVAQNALAVAQNALKLKERNKENINNIKESKEVKELPSFHPLFLEFWKNYSPVGDDRKYKKACSQLFNSLPDDWKSLAVSRASEHEPERKVFFYLKDEDFLKVSAKEIKTEKPEWLTPDEQDDCLKAGIPICICRDPETGLYKITTKQQAEQFGLEIKSQVQLEK
jgi:hypothetical protein